MKRTIHNREIITVSANGINLQGTYHKVPAEGSSVPLGLNENSRIGILFLNSGFQPRAASGDAAVHWADSFARCGYPSFRFDLPGLGDSKGDLPTDLLDFVRLVNIGRYAPFLSSATKNLTKRFNLSGVVIIGHCAGSVSALYAAAASNDVKGLVLLDPYFHCEEPESTNVRKEFRSLVLRNRLAAYLSNLYDHLKYLSQLVRRKVLPKNANLPLLRCWKQLAFARLPILVLQAPTETWRKGDFDYIHSVRRISRSNHRIDIKRIEGTNHAFVKGPGKEAVREHTEQWLRTYFPSARCEENEASGSQASRIEMTGTVDSLAG